VVEFVTRSLRRFAVPGVVIVHVVERHSAAQAPPTQRSCPVHSLGSTVKKILQHMRPHPDRVSASADHAELLSVERTRGQCMA